MKLTSISYSKVFNLGDFQNEKIGVEVEVPEEADAVKVLEEAKKFVEFSSENFKSKLSQAKDIIANPDTHTVGTVNRAKEFIQQVNNDFNLLPSNASNGN